jgi:hypothetical protein
MLCLALTAEQQQAYLQLLSSKNSSAAEAHRCVSGGLRPWLASTAHPNPAAATPLQTRSFLAEALQLPDHQHDAKSSVLLDYAAWICT